MPESRDARAASARNVIQLVLKTSRASQLYPRHSRIRKETLGQLTGALLDHLALHGETTLAVRQLEIVSFGETVYTEPNRQRSLAFKLFVTGVRSIRLSEGLDEAEAEGLTDVLTLALAPSTTTEDLQTAAWERCFAHIAFEITEDSFAAGPTDDFDGFVSLGMRLDRSAPGARAVAEPLWQELSALADTEESDALPIALSPGDRDHLDAAIAEETARDLVSETGAFLLAALDGGFIAELQAPLERYFERLLAAGDLRRAARMLLTLRTAATKTGDAAVARALTDVVERIGRSKAAPVLGPLIEAAQGADDEEREGITLLLTAIGDAAVAPLCELLTTPAREEAMAALRALAPKCPRAFMGFLADPRGEIARTVIGLLVAANTQDVAAALVPALRHADPAVRRDALRALTTLSPAGAADLLLGALDDPLYEIRATALDALGTLRDGRVVAPLLRRIESRNFVNESTYEKREIFRTLGRVGTPEATAALARILSTKGFILARERQDELRCLAASALGLTGNAGARAVLAKHEKDSSDTVRRAVTHAIREFVKRGGQRGE